jgi:hypothetical protein
MKILPAYDNGQAAVCIPAIQDLYQILKNAAAGHDND